ncbi:MAG: hypothetical protein EBY87_03390 [Actinobacteria bacterium]|nr:hypothetical protein [Actinomycetota bacterium]
MKFPRSRGGRWLFGVRQVLPPRGDDQCGQQQPVRRLDARRPHHGYARQCDRFWVDRGWVKAGPDAKTPPIIKPVTNQEIFIEGRLRIESVENRVGGSLFAIPSRGGGSHLAEWNNKNAIKTQPYYLVMTDAKPESFAPDFPTPLPELSDGPHLAYAFQWMLFAGLVLFALYLVLREDRRAQRAKD